MSSAASSAAGVPGSHAVDVVVVGGGHNGLISAALTARSGLSTVLVEARDTIGGCASTVTDLGARFNICNCDHNMIRALPIMDELDLASHGLRYIETEISSIHLAHGETTAWPFFHDPERHLDALGRIHPAWVPQYRRYLDDALPVARLAIDMARTTPSTALMLRRAAGLRGRGARRLLAWSRSSAADVLRSYFDDWRIWMPAVSNGPTVWGVSPETPGTGLAAALYATKHINRTGRPVGGSGALTDAIEASFLAAGGTVITSRMVEQLVTDSGGVCGVCLDDGSTITARAVVAACDPQRVFVDWLDDPTGEQDWPSAAREEIGHWRSQPVHDGYESKIDAVISSLPSYHHADQLREVVGEADLWSPTTVIHPTPEGLADAHRRRTTGDVASLPTMLLNIPSVADADMQLSPDEHVLSLEVLFTPYTHDWSRSEEPARWLELLSGLCESGTLQVERWRAMTPDRYEREFQMHRGHTPAYAGSPLATLMGRPRPTTRHRSKVPGLYLGGAAAYPVAGVFGGAGRNAARAVIRDLGR